LLSVTDKSGLTQLAGVLQAHDFELIATGGTAAQLRQGGFSVLEVADLTGFPEVFGGRLKSLHPLVFGGILGTAEEDFSATASLGLQPIDVVCVNLYRFPEAAAQLSDEAAVIERIDIGGPALLRAAAKNHQRVTVLPDPRHYPEFADEVQAHGGGTSAAFRRRMAILAFGQVSAYDRAIAGWLEAGAAGLPKQVTVIPLRYGENPHQAAQLELPCGPRGEADLAEVGLQLLGGKQLSYNNLVDTIAAVKLVCDFSEPCCAVIKHTNPCGFGLGEARQALARALRCDPVSAFGGVFAFNTEIDLATAADLHERFLEIVAAPAFTADALTRLRKKKNVRLIRTVRDAFIAGTSGSSRGFGRMLLRQQEDVDFPELASWRLTAGAAPDRSQVAALGLAWKVCKHVKSNAIVLADGVQVLGVGAGQMSRVDSVRLAIRKAGDQQLKLQGAVAASDGFFPFPDGLELLHQAGLAAVVAPSGSIRDQEVAAAADRLGLTLLLTARRHFRH
jgi:phosphoribosylaminoimidazolecarboxamide formyltransferase/IMP cyclohydrolase